MIPRYDNLGGQPDKRFVRGISFQGAAGRFPVPDGVPTGFGAMGFGEMLPRFDNQISLHPRRADRWGVPIPHIHCELDDNDRALVHQQVGALREMTKQAGYQVNFIGSVLGLDPGRIWPDYNAVQRLIFRVGIKLALTLGAAIHECGGARMGHDPRTSVLNGANQTWDVPNLFVTDGASFPSSSTVGPALTIMALSARAAAFIAEQHAEGALHTPTERVTD